MVTRQLEDRVFGNFFPGDEFPRSKPEFDEVFSYARQFEDALSDGRIDDVAWHRYNAAMKKLGERITIPDLPEAGTRFAIDHYSAVEIEIRRGE